MYIFCHRPNLGHWLKFVYLLLLDVLSDIGHLLICFLVVISLLVVRIFFVTSSLMLEICVSIISSHDRYLNEQNLDFEE